MMTIRSYLHWIGVLVLLLAYPLSAEATELSVPDAVTLEDSEPLRESHGPIEDQPAEVAAAPVAEVTAEPVVEAAAEPVIEDQSAEPVAEVAAEPVAEVPETAIPASQDGLPSPAVAHGVDSAPARLAKEELSVPSAEPNISLEPDVSSPQTEADLAAIGSNPPDYDGLQNSSPQLYGESEAEDIWETPADLVQNSLELDIFSEPDVSISPADVATSTEDDPLKNNVSPQLQNAPRLYGEPEEEEIWEAQAAWEQDPPLTELVDENVSWDVPHRTDLGAISAAESALNVSSDPISLTSRHHSNTYISASVPRLHGEPETELPEAETLDVDHFDELSQAGWVALVMQPDVSHDSLTGPPNGGRLAQATSVDQLSDVSPTDWSYQALKRLIEDYKILQGYPDNTFRGDNTVTRYEFASALRQVLDQILALNNASENASGNTSETALAVDSEDMETLGRLTQDFSAELGEIDTLDQRIDILEADVAELNANQFSPVARLAGRVTAGLAFAGGGDPPGGGDLNPVFAHLTQLQLAGSFTGNDVFRIGLEASDFANRGFANPDALNTNMALLGFQSNTNNSLRLGSLEYRFPAFDDRVVFTVKPAGFSLSTVLTPNTLYTDSGTGALSRFAAFNPYLRIGNLDAGIGLDALITDRTRLQLAYGARNSSDAGQGLINSEHRALGVQLLAEPVDNVTTGIAYINAFSENGRLDTFTGSNNADISGGINGPATIHALTTSLQWDINDNINVGAWFGAAITDSLPGDALMISSTYLFSLGFPNAFGRPGDLLGFLVGQPPRLRAGIGIERDDPGSGLHYEVFYRHRVNRHFTITPGFFYVSEPGHLQRNNGIWAAALRTTFQF